MRQNPKTWDHNNEYKEDMFATMLGHYTDNYNLLLLPNCFTAINKDFQFIVTDRTVCANATGIPYDNQ